MKITKPIVFFDLETTGLSTTSDRIVEIYMLKKNPDGTEDENRKTLSYCIFGS